MKQRGMKYDNSIDLYPISEEEIYELSNGSKMQIADITKGIPSFEEQADCIFIDPAGSEGVLKAYYTKADLQCPVSDFDEFIQYIKQCIVRINPTWLFVECFMRNRKALTHMVEEMYPCVRVYESMYYHSKDKPAWIIQGTRTPLDLHYDGMDEEDIVRKIPKDVPFKAITDFFMGRGLVAVSAFAQDKVFFGSDMNRNRLAVGIHKVADMGGKWNVTK